MLNIGIIVQARMGSTRLPGKILMDINGKPLLKHIIDRCHRLNEKAELVIATTVKQQDNIIKEFCLENGVEAFQGCELNVLKRFVECAELYGFTDIVRLTADNPFPDIEELDRLIRFHIDSDADFTYSDTELPEGMGAEIFKIQALQYSLSKADREEYLEHIDEYILQNKLLFHCEKLQIPEKKNNPRISLTIDTFDDYVRICRVANEIDNVYFDALEAIRLCTL